MEIYGYIYIIKNIKNNKLYIGQTNRKFDRRYNYKGKDIERVYNYLLSRKEYDEKRYNKHLFRAIEKYGFESFYVDKEFDIAYSKEELDKLEDMYIKIYQTTDRNKGYNNKGGGSNGALTPEARKKISEANKGKLSGENNPFYGKKHDEETRKVLRRIAKERYNKFPHPSKGKSLTEEQKKRISEANKGKVRTEEWKRELSKRMSGVNNPNYGRKMTDEQKTKISKANKGNLHTEEWKKEHSDRMTGGGNSSAKKILMINEISGEETMFNCMKDASQWILNNFIEEKRKIRSLTEIIRNICKGNGKTLYGNTYKYL